MTIKTFIQNQIDNHPFTSALVITGVGIALMSVSNGITPPESLSADTQKAFFRYGISLAIIAVFFWLGHDKNAGFSRMPQLPTARSWLVMLPLMVVTGINLAVTNWSALTFEPTAVGTLLLHNISAGLFEEVLLRGACFYILYRAWANQRHGVLKAALVQALIFGLLHLLNLRENAPLEVFIQVAYASLLGIGFAALVIRTASIWIAALLHSLINAAGSLNRYLDPDFVDSEVNVAAYMVAMTIIFLVVTVPALIQLKKPAPSK